jgi:hypothetical protein
MGSSKKSDNYEMKAGDIAVFKSTDATAENKRPSHWGKFLTPMGEKMKFSLWARASNKKDGANFYEGNVEPDAYVPDEKDPVTGSIKVYPAKKEDTLNGRPIFWGIINLTDGLSLKISLWDKTTEAGGNFKTGKVEQNERAHVEDTSGL